MTIQIALSGRDENPYLKHPGSVTKDQVSQVFGLKCSLSLFVSCLLNPHALLVFHFCDNHTTRPTNIADHGHDKPAWADRLLMKVKQASKLTTVPDEILGRSQQLSQLIWHFRADGSILIYGPCVSTKALPQSSLYECAIVGCQSDGRLGIEELICST